MRAAIGFFALELALKALLTPLLLALLRAPKGDKKARFTVTLAVARIVGAIHNTVQVGRRACWAMGFFWDWDCTGSENRRIVIPRGARPMQRPAHAAHCIASVSSHGSGLLVPCEDCTAGTGPPLAAGFAGPAAGASDRYVCAPPGTRLLLLRMPACLRRAPVQVPVGLLVLLTPSIYSNRMYGSSDVSHVMTLVSAGYFLHDLIMCILRFDMEGPLYTFHAVACHAAYTFGHHTGFIHYHGRWRRRLQLLHVCVRCIGTARRLAHLAGPPRA